MDRDITSLVVGTFIGAFVMAVIVNLHHGLLVAVGTAVIIAGIATPVAVVFLVALGRYREVGH